MASNSKGHVFVGTPNSKVYRTTDLGGTWTALSNGIDDGRPEWVLVTSMQIADNDDMYIGVTSVGLLKSTDNGNTWKPVDLGIAIEQNASICVSLKRLNNGQLAIFAGHSGPTKLLLRYSEDGGSTFRSINRPGGTGTNAIFNVFLSPNSNRIFAMVSYNQGLYRSDNYGTSWRRIENTDTGEPAGESDDHFSIIVANKQGHLFLGRNALPESAKCKNTCVLKSVNDGENWLYKLNGWDTSDITNNRIPSIAIGPNQDVWAMTVKASGLFYSSDAGETWVSRNEGMPNNGSGAGVCVTPVGHVFAAPVGFVHKHLNPAASVEDIPEVLQTSPAYPNPATDYVSIPVTLAQPALVTVRLANATGAEPIAPYQQHLASGPHTITLHTESLAPGMYVWMMTSDGAIRTGTIVVR
jgi:photosystem II stability/assembly factor-like uncharacterized protein